MADVLLRETALDPTSQESTAEQVLGKDLIVTEPIHGITDVKEEEQLRTIIADTYIFVRSNEINKTISGFTFDHYVDEAKRRIKEDTILRSALNPEGIGKRPSQLAVLEKLEADFKAIYDLAMKRAEAKDLGDVRDESASLR
jgi:hypothetical protein